jgi:hypothetical protein
MPRPPKSPTSRAGIPAADSPTEIVFVGYNEGRKDPPVMPARFAYSLNGENYVGTFASREDALAAGFDAARDPLNTMSPQTIFVARRVEADPHAAGHARTILREMAWQAHDEVGAPARNYLRELPEEKITDLDRAGGGGFYEGRRRHELLPPYLRGGGISEHPVPAMPSVNGKQLEAREVHEIGQPMDSPS